MMNSMLVRPRITKSRPKVKSASFVRFIVMAVTDPDAQRHRRLSMFIVPAESKGIEIVRNVGLGVDEIEHSGPQYWKDCSQCYVCEKWDKVGIDVRDSDSQMMKENIKTMGGAECWTIELLLIWNRHRKCNSQ